MKAYNQIIFISYPSRDYILEISKAYPGSKIFVWNRNGIDKKAMTVLASLSSKVLAEKCIQDEVSKSLNCDVTPVSLEGSSAEERVGLKEKVETTSYRPILFCPNNDTHVKMFAPVWKQLENARFLVFSRRKGEMPLETLEAMGIPYVKGTPKAIRSIRPGCLVFGNDWNRKMAKLIMEARALRIPTICLQEGCLDFGTKMRRMEWADIPFIQGPIMAAYFDQSCYVHTGNPRLDELNPEPLPTKPKVMINSNFTYGVFEDQRDEWVHSAAQACQEAGVEFFVCQHPRDAGQYPEYEVRRSNARKIKSYIQESSVLISRFSTVIYEAMCMGRQVVYHNPHGEEMRLFNEDETGGVFKSHSKTEAVEALKRAILPMDTEQKERFEKFLTLHCGTGDGQASRRVAAGLIHVARTSFPWDAPLPPIQRRISSYLPF